MIAFIKLMMTHKSSITAKNETLELKVLVGLEIYGGLSCHSTSLSDMSILDGMGRMERMLSLL